MHFLGLAASLPVGTNIATSFTWKLLHFKLLTVIMLDWEIDKDDELDIDEEVEDEDEEDEIDIELSRT